MGTSHPLLGKRLLVITAHPDDESYVMAGTLAANARAGGITRIVCATAGEKGASHLHHPLQKSVLAAKRTRELRAACRAMHVNQVHVCHIPDGQASTHIRALTHIVNDHLQRFAPDVVVSFGPCGITGHKDHVTVGKIAHQVARKSNVPFAMAVLSPKLQRAAKAFLRSRRASPHYFNHVRFVSPNLAIPISARIKRRALSCHQTQMDGGRVLAGFPKYVVQGLLTKEYFHLWKS